MKHIKMLGLVALSAVALTAFAGVASATVLTSPAGSTYTGRFHLLSEGEIGLHTAVGESRCAWTMEGGVETHGSAVTAGGKVGSLWLSSCTSNSTMSILKRGSLEIHTDAESADGNGRVTWVGAEITMFYPSIGLNCLFGTGTGIEWGTLTGSKNTGSRATIDINSAKIPRTGHSFFCGEAATLTGSFNVVSPTYLDVD